MGALSALVLQGVRLPKPTVAETAGGRPIGVIARQPRFVTAVICAVVSYLLMNFLMTAAPLAMHMCGLSQRASNLGIQWHVIAMYAPGFFTGRLIAHFGAQRVVMAGLALTAPSTAAGLMGVDQAHFWLTLILLDVGWNFGFVRASAMVLEYQLPEEKARAQSLNDFIVFGTMAFGSFLSGDLLATHGWNTVLGLSLVPLTEWTLAAIVGGRNIGRVTLQSQCPAQVVRKFNAYTLPLHGSNLEVTRIAFAASPSNRFDAGRERAGFDSQWIVNNCFAELFVFHSWVFGARRPKL